MDAIQIGLIGFGTVGTGVVKALRERAGFLRRKIGVQLNLKRICDRDLERPRPVKVEPELLTADPDAILEDPEIGIVIELVGGVHPAKELILKALRNGKHVVTANKALLAQEWEEIFQVANETGNEVYFEASVGGGIPIIKSLREGLISNEIESIVGIVNGTSNYILTQMEETGVDFRDALHEAQEKGYAERDPSFDIKGIDSAHKLAILASLGFGRAVRFSDIYVEGIQEISTLDIQCAAEFGYAVKLLAIAKEDNGDLELRVHPTLIPQKHLLASVRGVFNAIYLRGDLVGEQIFYGQGAGAAPTSSAVLSDIVDLAYHITHKIRGRIANIAYDTNIRRIRPIEEIETRYYLRVSALDRPGVLAQIAGILGAHDISIATVFQKERKKEQAVPVLLMTHGAREADVRAALDEIDKLAAVKRKTVAIRIESRP